MSFPKYLLGIECSGKAGSVAVQALNEPVVQISLPPNEPSGKTLAPTIQALFQEAGIQGKDLLGIAVTHGPGSFTGLRVGVATAKGLAYALAIPIYPVNTLEVLSAATESNSNSVVIQHIVLEAYRGELFLRSLRFENGIVQQVQPPTTILKNDFYSLLQNSHEATQVVLMPPTNLIAGWETYIKNSSVSNPNPIYWTEDEPTASSVLRLGWTKHSNKESQSYDELKIEYLRRSAAEEKAFPSS